MKKVWEEKEKAHTYIYMNLLYTHTHIQSTQIRKNSSRCLVIFRLPSHMTPFSDDQIQAILIEMTHTNDSQGQGPRKRKTH